MASSQIKIFEKQKLNQQMKKPRAVHQLQLKRSDLII
jgi:hypothetical protein